MNPLELLQNNELFGELDFAWQNRIAKNAHYRHATKGELLFIEGEPGDSFYLIESGKIRLFKSAGNDRETTIRTAFSGELIAEVILFESDTYPVSAEVVEDSRLLFLHRSEFVVFLQEPAFRDAFCAGLMKKMRYLAERVKVLSSLDVEERFLLYLSKRLDDQGRYTALENKRDIASEIGTIPETFSRMIKKMKQRSVLQWVNNEISVDKDYLSAVLDEIVIS
ncbi:MAG: Crp/Fnr family transcriptional regulator [Spirochaetes bacterium]|jgi:CRP-like cAMP-binding protein|nr:Crp/Fnr family transcriptional regulator [Spirochaetota bacterium]